MFVSPIQSQIQSHLNGNSYKLYTATVHIIYHHRITTYICQFRTRLNKQHIGLWSLDHHSRSSIPYSPKFVRDWTNIVYYEFTRVILSLDRRLHSSVLHSPKFIHIWTNNVHGIQYRRWYYRHIRTIVNVCSRLNNQIYTMHKLLLIYNIIIVCVKFIQIWTNVHTYCEFLYNYEKFVENARMYGMFKA